MTSKEAKSILNAYRNRNYNSTFREALELAKAIDIVLPKYVELEKRDTPMIPISESIELICPKCREEQHTNTAKFCSECGQRLDWSDNNE